MSLNEEKIHIGNIDDVRLTFNRVLLKVEKIEEKTKGGIIIPDQAREADFAQGGLGEIVKLGPLAYLDHGEDAPSIGETVRTNVYVGLLYEDQDGNNYRLVQDKDIGLVVGGA